VNYFLLCYTINVINMLAEIQGTGDTTETKAEPAGVAIEEELTTSQVTQDTPDTTTEESQITEDTSDTTTEESQGTQGTQDITPGGAGLAYASALTLTALCVVAMML
jgi:hypothetical protein